MSSFWCDNCGSDIKVGDMALESEIGEFIHARCPERSDPVNSPDHYRWLPVEVIEITEHFSFTLGNALKYIMRADHKGKPIEDLKKARWYIDREISRRLADEESRA